MLRSKETAEQTKKRQTSDTLSKLKKQAAKAAGFEKSFNPNDDWNYKLNTDMIRKHNKRTAESDLERKARKERDAIYQRKKLSKLSETEMRKLKQNKAKAQRLKRATEKEEQSKLWSNIHRQNKLQPLLKCGSYLKFLCNSDPRTSFYGQALPEVKELCDWKWIVNDVTDENMTKLEFFELSKKFATFFSQLELIR